jgi:hypothetical protein
MISSSPRPQTAPVDLTPSTVLRRRAEQNRPRRTCACTPSAFGAEQVAQTKPDALLLRCQCGPAASSELCSAGLVEPVGLRGALSTSGRRSVRGDTRGVATGGLLAPSAPPWGPPMNSPLWSTVTSCSGRCVPTGTPVAPALVFVQRAKRSRLRRLALSFRLPLADGIAAARRLARRGLVSPYRLLLGVLGAGGRRSATESNCVSHAIRLQPRPPDHRSSRKAC